MRGIKRNRLQAFRSDIPDRPPGACRSPEPPRLHSFLRTRPWRISDRPARFAPFSLSGPLCTVLGRLEADAGTLQVGFPDSRRRLQATPPASCADAAKELPAATAATPVVKLTDTDFRMAAATLGPAGTLGRDPPRFRRSQSGGKSGFGPAGKPIIAYEGHTFRKLTNHAHDEQYPLLSYKYVTKAGPEWKLNNKDQETGLRGTRAGHGARSQRRASVLFMGNVPGNGLQFPGLRRSEYR